MKDIFLNLEDSSHAAGDNCRVAGVFIEWLASAMKKAVLFITPSKCQDGQPQFDYLNEDILTIIEI